jgi:hypothetical protein
LMMPSLATLLHFSFVPDCSEKRVISLSLPEILSNKYRQNFLCTY